MSTFQNRVDAYVGSSNTTNLSDWLTSGAKWLINLMSSEKLLNYTTDLAVGVGGAVSTGNRIIRAHKDGYKARFIDAGLKASVEDSSSIFKATLNDPVAYVENDKIYIKPGGGTAIVIPYPTVLYNDTDIANFPSDMQHGVVLYAAIQAAIQKYNSSITTLNSLTFSDITKPTAPTLTEINYVDAVLGTYTSTSIGSFGTAPVFVIPDTDFSLSRLNTLINTDEDISLSQAELNQQKIKLEKYSAEIQNALALFNEGVTEYNSNIQKAIEQARLDQERILKAANDTTNLSLQNQAKQLESEIISNRIELEKYSSEIQSFNTQINQAVSKYSANIGRLSQIVNANNELIKSLKIELKDFLNGVI